MLFEGAEHMDPAFDTAQNSATVISFLRRAFAQPGGNPERLKGQGGPERAPSASPQSSRQSKIEDKITPKRKFCFACDFQNRVARS